MRLLHLLVLVPALAAGTVAEGRDSKTTANSPAQAAAAAKYEHGRKIYNFRCYYCHGYSGNARTLAATYLNPKPRDFTTTSPQQLSRAQMIKAVHNGRPGTAMASFANILTPAQIGQVVDFVRDEFMRAHKRNTSYHTAANGWFDHQRYAAAFPFATGKIPLDTPWEKLNARQRAGKRLFISSCISCHDRARVNDEGPVWEPMAVSYPRNNTSLTKPPPDSVSGASVYARHDRPPRLSNLTALEHRGQTLYQENCAFCHGADGTGRNWIGSFLEPHPRDLTSKTAMAGMTRDRLRTAIRDGLPGSTMSAWKSVLTEDQIQAIIAYVNRAFYPLRQSVQGAASPLTGTRNPHPGSRVSGAWRRLPSG